MTLQRLARLVPPLSASQLGLFRIVFGALLFEFLDENVLLRDPLPRELHRNYTLAVTGDLSYLVIASALRFRQLAQQPIGEFYERVKLRCHPAVAVQACG